MTPPAFTSVYYSSAFVAAEHEFDTTRKSAWIATSLGDQPIPGVQLVEPVSLGEAELQMVHSAEYVRPSGAGSRKRSRHPVAFGGIRRSGAPCVLRTAARWRRPSWRSRRDATRAPSRAVFITRPPGVGMGTARSTASRWRLDPFTTWAPNPS